MSHKRFLITVDDSCVPTILFSVLLSNGSHCGISTLSPPLSPASCHRAEAACIIPLKIAFDIWLWLILKKDR